MSQEHGNNRNCGLDEDSEGRIRVTDRRRIHVDDNGTSRSNSEVASPSLKPTYVEELEARTQAAERLVQEVQSRFDQLRSDLQREVDQTRQRLNRAADERVAREQATFIASLLPVLDDLQRGTEAADSGATADSIIDGLRHTTAGFEKALASLGVQLIDSVGSDFNPELHEAVDAVEAEPEQEGKVLSEYSRGYRMGDRLLRPARVKVGRLRKAETA